ncbi:MAG: extracellular solute-binding protein [Gammaproteobacteria bacterium]|jgi:arabinogalactan oligomer/maltooligosaccharide transport system substrate-binding protein
MEIRFDIFSRFARKLILFTGASMLLGANIAIGAELVVWHAYRGEEKTAFEKAVAMFNEAHAADGISARTLAVPFDAYADKITAAVPRGRGPDVFIFAQDRLGGWVEGGQTVEPIDFFIEDETLEMLIPDLMEPMTYRGTIYGLPFNYKSITLIYNKALVTEPPKTSAELVATAKELTDASIGNFGLAYEYSNYFFHAALMNAFGGRVFDPGPTPSVNIPENVKAVNLMMDWYKKEGILPADPSAALIGSLFNSGKAAMVLSGPWFLSEVEEDVDFGLAVLPTVDEAGGEPMGPWLTVEGIYISAGSKHKEEAYELLKYMVSDEAALVMSTEGGQLPSNLAVYENPDVANDPVLSAFRAQLETAVPMPNYAEMTLMWSPVTTAMNKIVKGSASPEVALGEAQATLSKSIEALRKGR